jgi:hypothetical protein
MKKFMITGGLAGFAIGIVFGLVQQSSWPSVIWRASVAALGAGLLMRWWGGIWCRSLQQAYQEHALAQAQATEHSAPNLPAKS